LGWRFCWPPAQNHSKGRKVLLVNEDLLGLQVLLVHKAPPVLKVLPAWQALPARPDRLDLPAPSALPVLKAK
jgi:hypothetical protein